MASAMHPEGFYWPKEASTGNLGWGLYLPVSLRERSPLIFRQILGKHKDAAPPIGDVVLQVGIFSFNELTDTLVLETTVDQVYSFVDNVNSDEWVYQDLDISTYCDANTSHLWIVVSRAGTNQLDTLEYHVHYLEGRTLIEEDEP